jgi:hypothetical protein
VASGCLPVKPPDSLRVASGWPRGGRNPPGSFSASVDTRPCPAFLHFAFFILPSPRGGLGWLCPAFQGSKFEVRGSRFGFNHKPSESNSSLPPPSGWSGGTLDKHWTHSGTIEPLAAPVFDQARLSKSVPLGSSALSRYSAFDVGSSMLVVGCWMSKHQGRNVPSVWPRRALPIAHRVSRISPTSGTLAHAKRLAISRAVTGSFSNLRDVTPKTLQKAL